MSRNKRTLLIAAVLGLSLVLAGCTSVVSDDSESGYELPENVTAEELQTKAVNASQSVETGTVSMESTVGVDGESIEMSGDGAIDLNEEKMRMEMSLDLGDGSTDITQYVIGDTTYVQSNGVWQQQENQFNTWNQNQYMQQQEALESASDVEVVDKTTTNGHDVYVMEVDVDEDELKELVQQQGMQQGMEGLYEQMDISNVEVTQHIDTETHQIRHFEMEMDMSVMDQETSMTMSMTYDSINEPVDITLPEEAENAPERGTAV